MPFGRGSSRQLSSCKELVRRMVNPRHVLLSVRRVVVQGTIFAAPAIVHHQRFWTPTAGEQAHTLERGLNVAPRQWMYSSGTFVPCSSIAAKLGIPDNAVEQQELLWRQYFLDPTLWWDCRRDKESASFPDFRHKESKEPLWVKNFFGPEWLDAQLTVLDKRIGGPARPPCSPLLHHNASTTTVPETHAVMGLCEDVQLSRSVDALTILAETPSRVSTSLLYKVILRCVAERNLVLGRRVDDLTVKLGYESNAFLGNHILRMYACQGQLQEAMEVFRRVAKPSVFMWFSIISAHAKHGKPSEAVKLYHEMRSSGLEPNNHIFVAALQACARAEDVDSGKQVHSDVLESGIQPDSFVCNSLVDMYAKCGELQYARRVFDSMATRGVVASTAMISGYAKCGKLEDAHKVFDSLSKKNVVTWTAMINGYAEHGLGPQALTLYARMEQEGLILADSVTYACLLKACAGAVQQGRQLHLQIVERGLLEGDVLLGNCLVNMYGKSGQLEDALKVFDSLSTRDVVTWNAMINGYAEHGLCPQALTLYARMEQEGLILANGDTFGCLLKACAKAGALQQGMQLHSQIVERGLLEGDVVLGNSLVNMYAKCGQLEDARKVFDSLSTRDAVTWNAMINGYVEYDLGLQALTLYARMEQDGVILANSVTFACLLKACATAGALQQGRQLHAEILERGLLQGDVLVGNCLVSMYAKCGQLEDARKVFDSLSTRDAVTWNAMISGYGTNNKGHEAISCFQEMMVAGIQPDDTTFTCLLVACSHEGLVSKGRQYFEAMLKQHGVNPTIEHYTCMVDLLGRAGHTDEAEKMLLSVGCTNNAVGWRSLLSACKSHGDLVRGARCFGILLELDPKHASAYVLMANMYADADRWADVDGVERLRKSAGACKKPAVAGIEVNKQVHTFVVGEERGDISCKVRSTNVRLKEEGNHVPHIKLVLKPLSEKEKEDELCGHAEKLALAYGLLNTPDGTPLLVTKNLRMCSDCHSSTEIMSRVEKRDIVVRDGYRMHRFRAGSCSCKGRH